MVRWTREGPKKRLKVRDVSRQARACEGKKKINDASSCSAETGRTVDTLFAFALGLVRSADLFRVQKDGGQIRWPPRKDRPVQRESVANVTEKKNMTSGPTILVLRSGWGEQRVVHGGAQRCSPVTYYEAGCERQIQKKNTE